MSEKLAKLSISTVHEEVLATPKGRRMILICGLPGSGYVGKLAADHLISLFKARKVVEYSCEDFPPQVNIDEDGVAVPLKAEVYFAHTGKGHDLLIFTADAQPATSEGEYDLADAVVGFAKKRGVRTVFTLAAYITGSFSNSPKVYAAATSRKLLDGLAEKGATLMREGGISGMNGLVIGMAGQHGLEGACLLGETSGYVVDAGASKSVLEMLEKATGVAIDTSKLKEKAEETQKLITQLQSMAEQAREAAPPRRESKPGYIS